MAVAHQLRVAILDALRRRDPTVLWPLDTFGPGNLLYFWLQAAGRVDRGEPTVVRATPNGRRWASWFPRVADQLVLETDQVPFFSRREVEGTYQGFGVDYTAGELRDFIDTYVLDSVPFQKLLNSARHDAELTINVRRGDYYSVPKYRGRYSFDVVEYVKTAVRASGPADRILIVTDDRAWCKEKLAWLGRSADVLYPSTRASAAYHLALLANSRRLILANSTFSYWGGYLSNRIHLDNHAQTWAPWFHSREWDGGAANQLDPGWSAIRDIPGGWDG